MRKNIFSIVAVFSALLLTSCEKDEFAVEPYVSSSDDVEENRVDKASAKPYSTTKVVFYYTYDYENSCLKEISEENPLEIYGDLRTVYFFADAPDSLRWTLSETTASISDNYKVDFKWAGDSGFQDYNGEEIIGPASFALSYSNGGGDGKYLSLTAVEDGGAWEKPVGECGIIVKYARLRVKGFYHCYYEKKNESTFYVHEKLSFNVYYGSVIKEEGTDFYFTAGTSDEALGLKTYSELYNVTEIDASQRNTYVAKWDPVEDNPGYPYLKTLRVKARYGINDVFFNERYTGMDIDRLIER